MSRDWVPFNQVSFDSGELEKVKQAVSDGHISGDGPFSRKAEELLSDMHMGSRALLTPSCSHALELAARLIGFEPGDEVIVPSFTFVTSVSSFVSHGATPVFCDIDPVTLGLDLEQARSLVTPRTRAIVLVHYGGVPANPEGFAQLAEDHGIILIEDNAHGLGGSANGRPLGTFGAMSTLSFHETKNITCGEGGALVINASQYIERAEILREKGTDRSRFFRGQVDKYTWQDLGSSWILSDMLAAILYAQLLNFEEIQGRRQEAWWRYFESLRDWASDHGFGLQNPDAGTAHLFYVLLSEEAQQAEFIQYLKTNGVAAVFHYQPLHRSPFVNRLAASGVSLPITDHVARSLVRLPLFAGLKPGHQKAVIEISRAFTGA